MAFERNILLHHWHFCRGNLEFSLKGEFGGLIDGWIESMMSMGLKESVELMKPKLMGLVRPVIELAEFMESMGFMMIGL